MIHCVTIVPLSEELEKRVERNPLLNIDTFIIPSPYIQDKKLKKDREHSYVWMEEGEILGFMLVYSDPADKKYLIYKLVTSPFGRGRGIGTTLIEHLAKIIPDDSQIYLYVWEKQLDTLEFFQNKGFQSGEKIVYRNLVYHYLSAEKSRIKKKRILEEEKKKSREDIGKTRHDARKTLKLLSHMVEMLSPENGDRIIEDINRESTTLINTLNSFRDTMLIVHTVNLKELILERIVPYIEASYVECELNLRLIKHSAIVRGFYVDMGRALINLTSNALDAIAEKGNKGRIWISLSGSEGHVELKIRDNGVGIPYEKQKTGEEGVPRFVGTTTKNEGGEGIGTQQIFNAFGKENIRVESRPGEYTLWTIDLIEVSSFQNKQTRKLERQYYEFFDLWEELPLNRNTSRTEAISFIWQLRKLEIFLYDVIFQFSKYNNIRLVYRTVLSYLQNSISEEDLDVRINEYQVENPQFLQWLKSTTREIRRRMDLMNRNLDLEQFKGALFKSYGQSNTNVIIFTMDPETGNFLATDRKLAEHLDFAPYLGKEKDQLLRGEFIGDMNHDEKPISFGVWSIDDDEDLMRKLKMIRKGAKILVDYGLHKEKRLAFYQTTYIRHNMDIDTYASSTFGEFSSLSDKELEKYIRPADEEFSNFFAAMD